MKYQMTLWIANRAINKMMKQADLCPSHKVFAHPIVVNFETDTKVNNKYFARILEAAAKGEDTWAALIQYGNNMYLYDDKIRILSDGEREYRLL